MAWRDAARRAMIGEMAIVLQDGDTKLWIRPKKLSVSALDRIKAMRKDAVSDPDFRERLRRVLRLEKEHPGLIGGKVSDTVLSVDEMADIGEISVGLRAVKREAIFRVALEDGIGQHNFTDDAGALVGDGTRFDSGAIDEILGWADLAERIFTVIEAYNAPLAGTTVATSPMSQTGSTQEPGTTRTPGSSRTVETPRS